MNTCHPNLQEPLIPEVKQWSDKSSDVNVSDPPYINKVILSHLTRKSSWWQLCIGWLRGRIGCPGLPAELQVACKELCETKKWLAAVQGKTTPPLPHKKTLIPQAQPGPSGSQKGESKADDMGDKVGVEADEDKADVLPWPNGKQGTKVSEVDQLSTP